jgi:hypothetical protein
MRVWADEVEDDYLGSLEGEELDGCGADAFGAACY